MLVTVTFFSRFDTGFLEEEPSEAHNRLGLNGAQYSSPPPNTFHEDHGSWSQEQVIHGPVHKLHRANPLPRRAAPETKHVEQGLVRGCAGLS